MMMHDTYSCDEIDVRIVDGLEHDSGEEVLGVLEVIMEEAPQCEFPENDVVG